MLNYSLRFYNKDQDVILNISNLEFMGVSLDIPKLKERFNRDFVKNSECSMCIISIFNKNHNDLFAKFICGFRGNNVVIINETTKQEYTPSEFSGLLNVLQSQLEDWEDKIIAAAEMQAEEYNY